MAYVIFNLCVAVLIGIGKGVVLGGACADARGHSAAHPPCGGAAVRAQPGHGVQPAQQRSCF